MTEPTIASGSATSGSATAGHYGEAAVVEASAARGEPDWLRDRRAEGARAFAATPLPTPALRPWKYTDITGLDIESFAPVAPRVTVDATVPGGGFAGSLAEAAAERGDLVREHLGSLVTATEGKFAAANAALWAGGVLVYAPRGAAFEQPVVVTVDATLDGAAMEAPSAVVPRLLVVAEESAEVSVVVRNRSGDGPLLAPGVVEVVAGESARIRLTLDGRWGAATQEFTTVRSRLARDADVLVSSIVIGGATVKQTIEAMMEGEGAKSVIRGVALGDGEQHFDFVTLQDHIGPRTSSDVQIKSALAGASRSIYYGVTRVEETAAGAEANQQNRNLLLSEHAKADSDPVLEILTADVIRCGHAATVGPVDREALFYLQSRGLDYRAAVQLLVHGFFQSVAAGISLPEVTDELYEAVTSKLATAEL